MFWGVGHQTKGKGLLAVMLVLMLPKLSYGDISQLASSLALTTAAVGSIVTPIVNADAEKYAADRAKETTIGNSIIKANLERDLTDKSVNLGYFNTMATLRMQAQKIQADLTATWMTTMERMSATNAFYKNEHEKLRVQDKQNKEKLATEEKLGMAKIELEKAKLAASMVASGISQGFKVVGDRLGITSFFNPQKSESLAANQSSNSTSAPKAIKKGITMRPLQSDTGRELSAVEAASWGKTFASMFSASRASGSSLQNRKRSDLESFERSVAKSNVITPDRSLAGQPHLSRAMRNFSTNSDPDVHMRSQKTNFRRSATEDL